MKNVFRKIIIFSIYLFLILWVIDFEVQFLFDTKLLLFVILGTLLLSLGAYKKGMKKEDVFSIVKWNSQLTGALLAVLLLLLYFSENGIINTLVQDICLNLRPLIYGFFIYLITNLFEDRTYQKNVAKIYEKKEKNRLLLFNEIKLTSREIEIAQMLLLGASNKEIADKLFIAESTVKKHTQNIYKKANVKNRYEFKEHFE